MKVEVQSKKGLRTILSVIVDKKTIQNKMDERLNELQKEVSLKGFRTGKVPTSVIINFVFLILVLPSVYFIDNSLVCKYWFFSLILIYTMFYIRLYHLTKNQFDI